MSDDEDDGEFAKIQDYVQMEFEKMNQLYDQINALSVAREHAREQFDEIKSEQTTQIDNHKRKLQKSIERARPWYENKMEYRRCQDNVQHAAALYDRASGDLNAAKEMIRHTAVTMATVTMTENACEKASDNTATVNASLQEVLNAATSKVLLAEKQKEDAERRHQELFVELQSLAGKIRAQEKEFKGAIKKSAPYFDMLAQYNDRAESKRALIQHLDKNIASHKLAYDMCLSHLQELSESIHKRRRDRITMEEMGTRGAGVGAEVPLPPPSPSPERLVERRFVSPEPTPLPELPLLSPRGEQPSSPILTPRGDKATSPLTDVSPRGSLVDELHKYKTIRRELERLPQTREERRVQLQKSFVLDPSTLLQQSGMYTPPSAGTPPVTQRTSAVRRPDGAELPPSSSAAPSTSTAPVPTRAVRYDSQKSAPGLPLPDGEGDDSEGLEHKISRSDLIEKRALSGSFSCVELQRGLPAADTISVASETLSTGVDDTTERRRPSISSGRSYDGSVASCSLSGLVEGEAGSLPAVTESSPEPLVTAEVEREELSSSLETSVVVGSAFVETSVNVTSTVVDEESF